MNQVITIDGEKYEVDRTVAGLIDDMQTEIETLRQRADISAQALETAKQEGFVAGLKAAINAVQSVYMTREPLTSPEREYYAEWQSAVTDCEHKVADLIPTGIQSYNEQDNSENEERTH